MGSEKEALVFDFGKTNVRLVHVDTAGERPQIIRFAEVPWDFETPEGQRKDELKSHLAAFDLANGPAAVVTWEEGMVFRQVILPDMPPEDLKKAFQWEIKEKFFLNEEEILLGSECVAEMDRGAEEAKERLFAFFYCDRSTAMKRLVRIQGMGLKVSRLVPGQVALAHLLGDSGTDDADTLIFDIGYGTARIAVVHRRKIMLSRSVLLGGQSLTEMMTSPFDNDGKRVKLETAEAEQLKVKEGAQNPQAAHISLLRPYLEKVLSEIKRSVDFYESQKYSHPISKVVFTGGGSSLKGLGGFMGQFLKLEVQFPTLEPYLSSRLNEADRGHLAGRASTYLAALGATQVDPVSPLDLLPKEIKFAGREQTKRMSFRMLFSACAILLTFLIIWTALQTKVSESQLRAIDTQWNEINRVSSLLNEIEIQDRFMRNALAGDIYHPGFLRKLSLLLPDSTVLDEIRFDRKSGELTIAGSVGVSEKTGVKVIAQLISDLQKTPYFKEVTLVKTVKQPEGQTLAFELRCVAAGIV